MWGTNMFCDDFIKKNIFRVFILTVFLVLFLSYEDPYENVFLIICIIALLSLLKWLNQNKTTKNILCLIVFCFFFYVISTLYLFTKSYDMEIYMNKSRNVKEEKAVLIVYDGEGEKYSLYNSLTNISIEENLLGKLKAPFLLYQRKNSYKKIGKSNYLNNTTNVKEKLEEALSEQYQIYVGYLKDYKYVEEVIFNIVNDGYNKIIIVPIIVSDDDRYEKLKARIDNLKLFNLNIQMRYVDPLWNSEAIVNSYFDLIERHIEADNNSDVGIVLIGRCPRGYQKGKYIDGVKQQLMFMQKLQSSLIANGIVEEHKVRISWFECINPDYIDEVKGLFEYGVGEIICIYINPGVTNIKNNSIAHNIGRKVEIPEGVNIKIIDGFLMDKKFVRELKRRIEFTNLLKWD